MSNFTQKLSLSVILAVGLGGMTKAASIKGTVLSPIGKPVQDAVVYIEKVDGKTFAPPKEEPVVDQKNLVFSPHTLPVIEGTTVRFLNSDNVRHNVFSPSKTKKFNLGTYPKGQYKTIAFDKAGVVSCLCNVHAEMSAFIVVLQNPYFAVSNKEGAFNISDVPAGNYKLAVWHEKMKAESKPAVVPVTGSINVDFKLSR